MSDENTDTKTEKNFAENELIGLFEEEVSPTSFPWFSKEFFSDELSLASADSTIHVVRIYLKVFALTATREGRSLFTRSIPYPIDNRLKIATTLKDNGFVLVGEHLDDHVFATDDMIVSLFDNGYMNSFSTDPRKNEEVFNSLNDFFHVTEEIVNRAYVLEQSAGGFEFRPYPILKRALIPENYMPSVVEDLPRLYAVVNNEEPFGRLAVLEGQPGGGKTSLIRGMMNEFGRPKFVIVPPYLVTHLNSPSMISSLVREQANDPRPLVLVLEDADQCLTTRAGDNMSNISAVLNLAEGILSDTLDIRIVATTNAEKTELDRALTRPGRLGAYLQVPHLSIPQAVKILVRLRDDENFDEKKATALLSSEKYDDIDLSDITLADVYAVAAKEKGTYVQVSIPQQRRAVGFG
jgi:hypothetical protein